MPADGLGPDGSLGSDSGDGWTADEVVYPNLGSQLSELAVASAATSGSGAESALGGADGGSVLPDGTSYTGGEPPLLTVELDGNRAGVLDFLRDNGVTPANVVGDYLEVFVPPDLLGPLAQQTGVSRVREMPIPFKNDSASVSALTAAAARDHGAGVWHHNGFTGDGVKIGVIDTSTTNRSADGFTGLRALLGKGLPSTVVGRCYNSVGLPTSDLANCDTAGGDDHGTRVAEAAIHFAPDAELYISNARSWADLQSSVEWMHRQGVKVIVYSVAWSTHGAGDGTTPTVPSPLSTAKWASDNGILWVSAAGNYAKMSWLGAFADSDNDGYHEWSGTGSTADESQMFHLGASKVVYLWMVWDDPWGYATKDLDLEVRYSASLNGPRTVVATSADLQRGQARDHPYEMVTLGGRGSGYYWVYAKKKAGSAAPSWVQIQTFRRQLEHYTEGGSIASPADSPEPGVLAVGAAAKKRGTLAIESYSSRGPTLDGRTKPDIVGLTCVTTVSGGFMCGTSQATPNVAGLAALVLERYPAYTARQVATYLKTNAADQGAVGTDNTWGHGFAVLPPSGLDATDSICATTALTGSGTVKGTWSIYCPRDGTSDGFASYYSFALDKQSFVKIRLSTALQGRTGLYLRRGGDTRRGYMVSYRIANPDQNAAISMSLPAGDYTIEARPLPLGELTLGSFTLVVQGVPALVRSGSEISIAAGADVTEGGDAVFTVTADPPPSAPLTVWVDVSGEGVFGVEEGLRPVTVSTAGSGSLVVSTDDDNADESDGSVTAKVDVSPRYTVSSSASSASVAVSDDEDTLPLPVAGDACVVALTGSGSFGGEWTDACDSVHLSGRHARFYTFTLDTQSTVTINLTSPNLLSGDLYLRNGSGQKDGAWLARDRSSLYRNPNREVSEISRNLPAGDYTIEAASYYTGSKGPFVLTVAGVPTVAEPVPEVSIASDGGVTEGGSASFTVTASPSPASDLSVKVKVTQTGDYGAATGTRTVTVPVGGTASFTVATTNDSADEADGSVTATLIDGADYDLGTAKAATVDITDDDDPVVSITGGSSVTEGGNASYTLTASPPPVSDLSVKVKVTQTGDYGAATGTRTVTVPVGGTVTFTVPTTNDSADEADGSVTATLIDGADYDLGTAKAATVDITDDDDPPPVIPVVSITGGAGVTEGGNASFTVTASPPPTSNLSVQVKVTQTGDYGAATGTRTVTVPVGGTITFTVATTNDSADEADGSVTATLIDGTDYDLGTAKTATVSVADDDDSPPSYVADPQVVSAVEYLASQAHHGSVHVNRWQRALVAMGALDSAGVAGGALTLAEARQNTKRFSSPVWGQVVAEIEAKAAFDAAQQQQPPSVVPVVSITGGAGVAEGGSVSFTVTASPPPASDLSVQVKVTQTGDYGAVTGTRTVTVPVGGTATFTVATTNDSADEADGSVSVTVVDGTDYDVGTASASVSVADDDDPIPAVSVSAGPGVTEGGSASFTVTASPPPASNLSVQVEVAQTGDYGATTGTRTVTVPVGGTVTFTVDTTNDSADEADGSVSVTVVDGADYDVGTASASVSVADDDDPPPLGESALIAEVKAHIADFTSRSHANGVRDWNLILDRLEGRTGMSDADIAVWLTRSRRHGWQDGVTTLPKVQAFLAAPQPVSVPEVNITGSVGGTEGAGVSFTVSAVPSPTADLAVGVSVSVSGDFGVSSGARTVTIPAGTSSKTLSLSTSDDSVDEADGSVTLTLNTGGGYTVGSLSSRTVQVLDDDDPPPVIPVVSITGGSSVAEGSNASYTLTASPPPASNLPVQVKITQTGDYGAATGTRTVTIPVGGTVTFTVATTNDSTDEADGSVTATLIDGADYDLGTTKTATVNITDNDDPPPVIPVVSITGGSSVTEGSNASYTLTANPPPTSSLSVQVKITQTGDYGATTGTRTVTVPVSGTVTFTVATTNDNTDEADGSVTATLIDGADYDLGTTKTATVNITDNDDPPPVIPVVSITGGSSVAEGGSVSFTVTATPPPTSSLSVQVKITQTGDYGAATGTRTVTVPVSGTVTFTVATTNDNTDETDGSVTATLIDGADYDLGTTKTATVDITDNDDPPPVIPVVSITGGAGVTEGGSASFTVTASPPPASNLSVQVKITQTGDYGATTGTRTVTVPVGGTVTFTVATTNDNTDETDGSVTATLIDGADYDLGTAKTATVDITDDDDPPPGVQACVGKPTVSAADVTAQRGDDLEFVISIDCAHSSDVVVLYSVTHDGRLYIAGAGTAIISSGDTTTTVTMPTTGTVSEVGIYLAYVTEVTNPWGVWAYGTITDDD